MGTKEKNIVFCIYSLNPRHSFQTGYEYPLKCQYSGFYIYMWQIHFSVFCLLLKVEILCALHLAIFHCLIGEWFIWWFNDLKLTWRKNSVDQNKKNKNVSKPSLYHILFFETKYEKLIFQIFLQKGISEDWGFFSYW